MKNLLKCTEYARTHLVRAKRIVRKSFKMWTLYLVEIGLLLTIFENVKKLVKYIIKFDMKIAFFEIRNERYREFNMAAKLCFWNHKKIFSTLGDNCS
jgi:hypothetical protein